MHNNYLGEIKNTSEAYLSREQNCIPGSLDSHATVFYRNVEANHNNNLCKMDEEF